jgi:hypothetical protein
MAGSKNKGSKNNPDLKVKKKENKIHESAFCEKCSERSDCKEYNDYVLRMKIKGKGFGVTCKRGR